jgi:hypothetical protein
MASDVSKLSRSSTDFRFHVPPPEDGDINSSLTVIERLMDQYKSAIQLRRTRATQVEMTLKAWKEAVTKQVGAAYWERFLDYSREQRSSNYGLKEFSPDPDGFAELAAARRAARDRSLSLLREAKLEPGTIKQINNDFEKELRRILSPSEARVRRIEIVPESSVPREIIEEKTNPWFIKSPPYDGWSWYYDGVTSGGTLVDLQHRVVVEENPFLYITGTIGHYSQYANYGASDFDYMDLWITANVGFWYKPTNSGTKEVWIKAQCKKVRSEIWLDDEFGWSSSDTWMDSFLTVDVSSVSGEEGSTKLWWTHAKGAPDSKWYVHNWIKSGDIFWFHFNVPFPSFWSYFQVGTYDWRTTVVNDVATSQSMENQWLIEQVHIED